MTTATSLRNKRRWEGAPLLWRLVWRNRAWMGLFFLLTFWVLPGHYMLQLFVGRSSMIEYPVPGLEYTPFIALNVAPARIFTGLSVREFVILVTAAAILILSGLKAYRIITDIKDGTVDYHILT